MEKDFCHLHLHTEYKESYHRNAAFRHLISTAQKLEGLPRHLTPYSAGVVISQKRVQVGGEITALRFRWSAKGTLVCFFTLEDLSGTAEVTVFESAVNKYKKFLYPGNIILLTSKIEKKENIYDLIAEELIVL